MPRVTINENKLHYQQMGSGPDIVLIHGLFSNIAFWWSQIAPQLAQTHRVTALDLRGHGLSGMTERGYRAVDLAEDVAALLEHLNIKDVHLVGHSYGGAISLATALLRPDLVVRVTLADAWVPSLQHQTHLPNVRAWPELKKKLQERGIDEDEDLPMVAMAFLEELAETPDSTFSRMASDGNRGSWMPLNRHSHGVRRWRRLMATTHAWKEFYKTDHLDADRLSKVESPVEMMYGVRSGYLKTRDGLARVLPEARRFETSGGHYFPVTQPQALTDLVLNQGRGAARRGRLAG